MYKYHGQVDATILSSLSPCAKCRLMMSGSAPLCSQKRLTLGADPYKCVVQSCHLPCQGHAEDVKWQQGFITKRGAVNTHCVEVLLTMHLSPDLENDGLIYHPAMAPPFGPTVENLWWVSSRIKNQSTSSMWTRPTSLSTPSEKLKQMNKHTNG